MQEILVLFTDKHKHNIEPNDEETLRKASPYKGCGNSMRMTRANFYEILEINDPSNTQ